jgi:hypothetical protein
MMFSRRSFLTFLLEAGVATACMGQQGISSPHTTAAPRGKPSGSPMRARFTDISQSAGLTHPVIYGPEDHKTYILETIGLTVVAADYDDDGWPDIYVACDSSPSLLLLNNHDGTFREQGAMRGVAYNSDGQEQAGMGVAVNDYDLDGRLDILKTNFAGDVPTLYHNEGRGVFDDAVREAGLAVENRYVAWGAGICDLDNDGLGDIFIVTGHVYPEIEARFPQFPLRTPRLLFHNIGHGRFEQVLPGAAGTAIDDPHCSRGCAFGDFDNDGDLDILIINLNEPPTLLRNDVPGTQHWLKIRLIGVRSNRSGIGARVVVETAESMQTQELQSQSSFLSANDPRLHFGLGKQTSATVRVRWTDGSWESLGHVNADQFLTAKEGKGIVSKERWGTLTPDRPHQ